MKVNFTVPAECLFTINTLKNKGFLAYLVGGCVRDLILNRSPHDWDITTNATPEEIIALFPKTFYENGFGTVTVVFEDEAALVKQIEITPFRKEGKYTDHRHPDEVIFSDKIEDDLLRRDFTINAIAYDPTTGELIDLYGGIKDIKDKVVKAVGNPEERFGEDSLRLMRAVRFATQLGFTIEPDTAFHVKLQAKLLKNIAIERIRDEFTKIIMSDQPLAGLEMLRTNQLLEYVSPETLPMVGVIQGGEHIYDVWEHSLRALQHAADKGLRLELRLAALYHDIGKPKTARPSPKKRGSTFYGHEVVGAKIARKSLENLRYPNKLIDFVTTLVRYHMFFADTELITLKAVRRVIVNVGQEAIWDLINVRICDRIGMGRPNEDPYRLRKYEAMIEEALRSPTSVTMLKINGQDIMKLGEKPGPRIGYMLHALLEETLDHPELNTQEHLKERVGELGKLDTEELKARGEAGKDKKEAVEEGAVKKIRTKHRVK